MKLQGQYQCALMAKGFVGLSLLAAILLLPAAWTSAAEGVAQTLVLRYATPGSGTGDAAYAIDLDSEGNVIVAGSTFERFTGAEMLVLKYSGAGAVLWTNRYNGPANGDDIAQAVAVDGSGNIFATGSSQGIGSGNDYVTIKYSGAGFPLWTNRYNGAANLNDQAYAVAVDGSGNLFVTGYSLGESKNYNYATIKYSNAGAPLWTNLYHTMATFFSYPNALAVDSVGNVFVTGIDGTVAYSNAGLLLWVNRGLSGDGIVVDGSGNVVVAGYSGGDYVTVKYSAAGAPLWTNYYNGPANSYDVARAVAVDSSGNVFVTGNSANTSGYPPNNDYATIAYSSAGLPLWTNRYNGLANSEDTARAVRVDSSGNVFVTGESASTNAYPYNYDYSTIAYSSAGVPLWTNLYNGPRANSIDSPAALAMDSNGSLFVTGTSYFDVTTIKYSNGGLPLWTARYDGVGHSPGYPVAIALDSSSNIIVTGNSQGSNSDQYTTIKYSSAGVPLWTNSYHGKPGITSRPSALAVDGAGNVFVTGYAYEAAYGDYVTIKYSASGVPLWTNVYDGPGRDIDSAQAIAVDGSGNVIVTGYSVGLSGLSEYATIKYSSAGATLWINRYGSLYGIGHAALALDGSGNVLVTGSSGTIKYSSAGVLLWTNLFDGANAIAVDASGNVFVTGDTIGGDGFSSDYLTIKYSSAGALLWSNLYNGPGNAFDHSTALALDSSGNVFVTGYSQATNADPLLYDYDYATIKYSNAGVPLWTNRYDGPASSDDTAQAVMVDRSGNVFVTGDSASNNAYLYNFDFLTIKYSNAGLPLWTNRYNGPANGDDWLRQTRFGLALGPDGAAYVTGASDGDYSASITTDFVTVKYVTVPLLTVERDTSGGYFVGFTGQAFVRYRLQRASTLTGTWSDLATNTAPASGLIEYHETSPPPGQAFYRAVQP